MDNYLDIFRIKTNNVAPKKGKVLIAEPFLAGSYFNRSIILLAEHSEEGSVGFILNKPIDFPIKDFNNELPNFKGELYMGGPVSTESIYYIHSLGDKIPNSLKIMDDLYWGGDYDCLKDLIEAGTISENDVRFFLGYSGWDNKQLSEELNEDSWLVADITSQTVMNSKPGLWKDMVKKQGGIYSLWENFPKNPSMN